MKVVRRKSDLNFIQILNPNLISITQLTESINLIESELSINLQKLMDLMLEGSLE